MLQGLVLLPRMSPACSVAAVAVAAAAALVVVFVAAVVVVVVVVVVVAAPAVFSQSPEGLQNLVGPKNEILRANFCNKRQQTP